MVETSILEIEREKDNSPQENSAATRNLVATELQEGIAIPEAPPRAPGNFRKAAVFGLIVTAQVGALFAFAAPYAHTLVSGKTVNLQCHSYDPRDMFKGDYVAVTYDVGSAVTDMNKFKSGDTAFLTLKKKNPYWRAIKADKELPKSLAQDEAVMRVTVVNGEISPPSIMTGIEKFYVPEGTGTNVNFERLSAEVSLANDGMPVLKRLISDGKEVGKK